MPRSLYPGERPGSHCIGGWVGPGPAWTGAENLSLPPGFDPRVIQPVASRYNDYAIPAPIPHSRGGESMNVQFDYHQLVRSRGIHTQVDVIVVDQRAPRADVCKLDWG